MPSPTDSSTESLWRLSVFELLLGANLVGDIDAEAEHVALAVDRRDDAIAVGEGALIAACIQQMEQALRLVLAAQIVEVAFEQAAALRLGELLQRLADDLLHGVAEPGRAVLVDGENLAVHVMRADQAERTFDDLAVARFALADGGLGDALHGDVDAGGDDEGDLAMRVEHRGCGPRDAAAHAIGREPVVLVCGGELPVADALEVVDVVRDLVLRDQPLPRELADEVGRLIAGDDLAGAIEAHDAAGGVEDHDQRADGVEHGGDEVAFDGERRLHALPCARGLSVLANAARKLEPCSDEVRQRLQRLELWFVSLRAELSRTTTQPIVTDSGVSTGAPA